MKNLQIKELNKHIPLSPLNINVKEEINLVKNWELFA